MEKPVKRFFLLPICALLLCACSRTRAPEATQVAAAHADAPGISWFSGDADAAFAAARQQSKPVLLYWGAAWCPPCQQLKATVFSREDFIEKTRLFIPVYLDGDDASAQKWGEQFRVQGYPTLVVLDGARHELMRIAGGMDLSQYSTVLDTVLADVQPIGRLLEQTAAIDKLDPASCRRLSFNAWTLEELRTQEFAARAAQLAKAAALCEPSPVEQARLVVFAAYFRAAAQAEQTDKGSQPSPELVADIAAVQQALAQFASDARLADAFQTLGENFFKAAKAAGPSAATSLLDNYAAAMDAEAKDANLAEADQLAALRSKLVAIRVLSNDDKIPEAIRNDVRARVEAVLAQQQTAYVRSSILNSVLNIYDVLGSYQEAYELTQAELPRANPPFYLKADLAELAEQLGKKDEALEWWNQAYREARGASTRFQWGQDYASALMRLKPQDATRIREVTAQALGELTGSDRIYRRSRLRLEKLDKDLRAWNAAARGAHSGVLSALRTDMLRTCTAIPESEPARRSCESFLSG